MNRIGIIGGTGFETALEEHFRHPGVVESIQTSFGEAHISRFEHGDTEIIFLARHGADHGVAPHKVNHHANISALKSLDLIGVLSTASVGSLTTKLCPCEIVLLDDFIDMRGRVTTFFDESAVTHTDFSEPFDRALREALMNAEVNPNSASEIAPLIIHKSGTYLCVSGPRYETPAEIRAFATLDAHLVGMTVAPEAILSKEIGLPYACVAVITNFGTGISGYPVAHSEVESTMAIMRPLVVELVLSAIDYMNTNLLLKSEALQ